MTGDKAVATRVSVSAQCERPWHKIMGLTALAMCICYMDRVNISVAAIAMQTDFDWDNATKGMVLSSFFAGYLVMQLVGGVLANRYGGRLVLGVSVVFWSIFTLLTPWAAYTSLSILVLTRILMGLGEGSAFPAGYNIIATWVPHQNHTKAVGLMMSGAAIGTVIALLSGGWVVDRYGWPAVFYLFGALGFAWAIAWFFVVPAEKKQPNSDGQPSPKRKPLPWKQIFRQKAIWAIAIAAGTYGWTFYIFLGWLPSYYKDEFGLSLAASGVYSALPWLILFFMHNVASFVATRLIKTRLSRISTRKLMQSGSNVATAMLVILLAYVESSTVALLLVSLAFAALAFATPGWIANVLDVAPKYSDVIAGLTTAVSSSAGLVSVGLTGLLIQWTGSYQIVFWVTATLCAFSALIWFLWCRVDELVKDE